MKLDKTLDIYFENVVCQKYKIVKLKNYTVTHCETLEEVLWLLGPEKPKHTSKIFKKLEKMQVLFKKIAKI